MNTGDNGLSEVLEVCSELERLFSMTGEALLARGMKPEGGAAAKILAERIGSDCQRLSGKSGSSLADVEPTMAPFLENVVNLLELRKDPDTLSGLALSGIIGRTKAAAAKLRKVHGEKEIESALELARHSIEVLNKDDVRAAIEKLNVLLPEGERYEQPVPFVTLHPSILPSSMQGDYTDRARKVLDLANQEAQRLNHEYIGTEHLLLGLVKGGSGVGMAALKNMEVDVDRIKVDVGKIVKMGPQIVTMGRLPLTPRGKRAISLAHDQAREFGHTYVGTEHLLLGLILEHDGVANQVLGVLNVTFERTRTEIKSLLGNPETSSGG